MKNRRNKMIKDLQQKLLNMGSNGCLCMCYLYYIDIDPEQLVFHYDRLVERGIIDEYCWVNDGDAFIRYFGSNKTVKKNIALDNNLYDRYIACYGKGNATHFVVVDKNNNIIYNPYLNSVCVKEGKLISKRVIA